MSEGPHWSGPTPRVGGLPEPPRVPQPRVPRVPSPEGFRPEVRVPEPRWPEARGAQTRQPAHAPQGPPEWDTMPEQWGPIGPGGPAGPTGPLGPVPPRRNRGLLIAIIVIVATVLIAGGGVAWFLWQRHSKTTAGQPTATGQASATASASGSAASGSVPGGAGTRPTATKAPEPPTEGAALDRLTALRVDSMKRLPLDGRWVAQVASKWVGVTDPLQTAQNGTHTFYARDILAESLAAQKTVDSPSKVYVVWGTDFGKKSSGPNGAPIWVTLVDAGYASHDNVLQWCHVTYPNLSPQQLADTCAPRQIVPPHE